MDLRLQSKERIRVVADDERNNFVDIEGHYWGEVIKVDIYPAFHYVEIREKNRSYRIFLFKEEVQKEQFDYGYYENAKVIFTIKKT